MRRIVPFMMTLAAVLALTMPPALAQTVTKTVDVRMPRLAKGAVVTVEPSSAMVVFGAPFDSIESLCFHVVMEGDLLDPDPNPDLGEALLLDSEKLGGRANISDESVAEFTLCVDPGTSFQFFLDGHERIHPEMEDKEFDHDDSVRIVEFTATVIGTR